MQTVEDESGRRYLLEKRSHESSRVRDPATGEVRYLENERVRPVAGESALQTAARAVSASVRHRLSGIPDQRALGLLAELSTRGPLSARTVLDTYDLCESDLHGRVADLQAAGLVESASVGGEPGYALTDAAAKVLAGDQSAGADT